MSFELVIGAGAIGRALATQLATDGTRVRIVTRSATTVAGAEALAVDASDAEALASAAEGASVMYLVASPPYHRWPELWPPLYAAAITAAERSGAKLVVMSNLYAYGEGAQMPMTEASPLRATEPKGRARQEGWELVLAAHNAGRIVACEVRASDYFGPGVGATSQLGSSFFAKLIAGKTAQTFGASDQPHSWCYLADVVATLIAAAHHEGEWGRAWHVPAAEPLTRQEIAERTAQIAGTHGKVAPIPHAMLRLAAIFTPLVRAANSSIYQFDEPFVSDASETSRTLGVSATPWSESLPTVIASYR